MAGVNVRLSPGARHEMQALHERSSPLERLNLPIALRTRTMPTPATVTPERLVYTPHALAPWGVVRGSHHRCDAPVRDVTVSTPRRAS
jgi:hypothetical protein